MTTANIPTTRSSGIHVSGVVKLTENIQVEYNAVYVPGGLGSYDDPPDPDSYEFTDILLVSGDQAFTIAVEDSDEFGMIDDSIATKIEEDIQKQI